VVPQDLQDNPVLPDHLDFRERLEAACQAVQDLLDLADRPELQDPPADLVQLVQLEVTVYPVLMACLESSDLRDLLVPQDHRVPVGQRDRSGLQGQSGRVVCQVQLEDQEHWDLSDPVDYPDPQDRLGHRDHLE